MRIMRITGASHWRLLLTVLFAGLGLYWAYWAGRRADDIMREALLTDARAIAGSVSVRKIKELNFSDEDGEKNELKTLSDQLKAYANIRGFRVIYMVAEQNGELVFGPESIDAEDPIAFPPGAVYESPPSELVEVFRTRVARTAGTFRDEYSEFVSAFAPIVDFGTGEVLAVVAIDIEAKDWLADVFESRKAPLTFVLIILAAHIAGQLALEWRRRIPKLRWGKLLYLEAMIIALIGLVVTTGVAWMTQDIQEQVRMDAFASMARAKGGAVRDEMNGLDVFLSGVAHLYGASEFVDRREFRSYAEPIVAARPNQGLFWIPEVSHDELGEIINEAQSDGIEAYSIWEWDERGERGDASPRDKHYPLLYVEPAEENGHMLGFDVGSTPALLAMISEIKDGGTALAVDPLDMLHLGGNSPEIVAIRAALSRTQTGFVVISVNAGTLLEHAMIQAGGGPRGLSAIFCYLRPEGHTRVLAAWPNKLDVSPDSFCEGMSSLAVINPVFQFGRSYAALIEPTHEWLAANPVRGGLWAGITGFFITGLFASFVAFVINRRTFLEGEVFYRTEELSESELRFRTLADSGHALIWTSGVEKKCDYFNRPWLEFTGRTLEQELGDGWTEGVHPEDLERCVNTYATAFDQRTSFSMVYRLRRHDGEYRWLQNEGCPRYDTAGNFIGFIGHCLDITPQIHAWEALAKSEANLKEAHQIARLGRWELDHRTEELTWSESAYDIMGIDPKVGGLTRDVFLDLIHPEDRDMVENANQASLLSGEQYEIEHRIQLPSGEIKWVYERCRHEFDSEGNPVRSVGIVQDITERKRIEGEMDALEEQLRQQQRLEVVGTLAAGVAHDFNNLLTGITGFARFAYEDSPEDSTIHEDMRELLKLADRAADLTRQLLAFSRKQTLKIEVININHLIEDLIKMLKRLMGERIDLVFRRADDLKNVKADVGQIEQILMNLVVNACDAMPGGGRLTIETANVFLDALYIRSHAEIKTGHYVMIAVTDTGTGMDEETRSRLFEPFYTTKELGEGAGLGLATVYGIVKQHAGGIWVYSEPGKGTTFKIYLPADMTASQTAEVPKEDLDIHIIGSGANVLIVEDDDSVRDIAARILESHGYRVWKASTPSEADVILKEHGDAIDLLLTDVILPECGGKEFYEKAAAKYKNLRVVFMSGYTDNAIVHQGVLDPGISFVQKPFTPETLLNQVRNVLMGNPDGT